MCEALTFLLDDIYIKFGSKLYRLIVGIPLGTSCAPLVADMFFFSVMRETSCCLFQMITNLKLLKLSVLLLDNLLNIYNIVIDSLLNNFS